MGGEGRGREGMGREGKGGQGDECIDRGEGGEGSLLYIIF